MISSPPTALLPLFEHEPLLADVTTVAEPFCGKGNLVIAMRQRGLVVHASDIEYRGCPDSTVLDFLKMAERPPGCDVLVSNCAYDCIAGSAMQFIEHALALASASSTGWRCKSSALVTMRLSDPAKLVS